MKGLLQVDETRVFLTVSTVTGLPGDILHTCK